MELDRPRPRRAGASRSSSVAAIVLAAGASTRMGRPKQVLSVRGEPMVRRVARAALGSSASPVLVVVGAHEEEIRASLDSLDVDVVVNREWETGQGSSVRAGVERLVELAPDAGGVVFLLADQPFVTAASIEKLIEAHLSGRRALVATDRSGRLGVPALFPSGFFDELRGLPGDEGARGLLARHESDAVRVRLPEADTDVDTPQDYEGLGT